MMIPEIHSSKSPEETRNRILFATRQLFAKHGRRGTTTREIADLAGVNEATLFRHFGSKDAIIDACAEHYCGTVELQEVLGSLNGDLAGDLQRIGLALAERMDAVRDLILRSLVEEETVVTDAAWRTPVAIRTIVGEFMAKRVASGELEGDPILLARFFMGMVFSQVIGRKKFPDDQRLTPSEWIEFQVNVFLNGTRKKK